MVWRVIFRVKMMSISAMRQLDLDDGSVWMDERRVVALFDVVAASMEGLAMKVRQYLL